MEKKTPLRKTRTILKDVTPTKNVAQKKKPVFPFKILSQEEGWEA